MRIFRPDAEGTLIERPNRFIVHVRLPEGEVRAHCPNPGRLIELMNPGRKMILERNRTPGRKTEWTLAAAEYRGEYVSMYSSRANAVAGELIIPRLFPGARDIRAEYPWNRSRFDWHFYLDDREIFLEVKACTLIEEGTAMFPDAPSSRAVRHLEELAELTEKDDNREGHAVFVIMNPRTERFIPNMHTDPDFAAAVRKTAGSVQFHAVSARCSREGELTLADTEVPVLTGMNGPAERDCGIYMILMTLPEQSLTVGSLGERRFPGGYYIYCGSAAKGLKARVARHLRKTKKIRWHADYLTGRAEKLKGFPIYTDRDLECVLAGDLLKIADDPVPGFGCSDCRCGSHLFYFRENPLHNREFLDLLFHYRHTLAFSPS